MARSCWRAVTWPSLLTSRLRSAMITWPPDVGKLNGRGFVPYPVVMLFVGVAIVTLSAGCRSLPSDTGEAITFHFDFDEGPLGFVAGFADYPPAHEEIYELTSGHRSLPPPLELQSGCSFPGSTGVTTCSCSSRDPSPA